MTVAQCIPKQTARAHGDVWRKEGHLLDLLDTQGLDFLTALSRTRNVDLTDDRRRMHMEIAQCERPMYSVYLKGVT